MVNKIKNKFKEDSFLLPSVVIFAFTIAMIGFDSDSVRYFISNVFQISLASLFGTFILFILVMPNLKKEDRFPFSLFWAVIAFMWKLGG